MNIGNKFSNGINKIKKHWEVFIILLLGLTPLLWYKNPNSLALGHDMGFPIDPINFFNDRLFLWTDRVGLGWDQTLGSAAILIHGFEALISKLGFDIFTTQKIVFIFWFVLPGLAMYYFTSIFYKEKEQWFIRLSASLFYMFNHFLLQGWFIAERTKISLFVALPLLLGLILSIIEKRISALKGIALMSLVFFFFNGGGGLPLYGGLLLALTLGFLFFGFIQLRESGRGELKRLFLVAIGILASFILANFYWILPTFIKSFSSYAQSLSTIGGISGVIAWSFEISKFASILNVMRLQGIPDWYDNPQHPFSGLFLNNPFLILISFLIPVVVFSSLFLIKKTPQYRRYIVFFNILAVLGIIFTAGSHPPFGVIYNLFLTFIPGFAIFRTPFYKFAPALWFAYSFLFSFSAYFLIKGLTKPKFLANAYIKNISFILIIVGILFYNFPFFTGSFFEWQKPLSTMTKLPSYILDFDKWVNSNISYDDRIITFPLLNTDWHVSTYKWGYWSTAPLASLMTNKSVIANDRVMTVNELLFTNSFYNSIEKDVPVWKRISQLMGINYFLLQNDFTADSKQFGTVAPAFYKEKFDNLEGIVRKQSFGEWDLYQISGNNPKKVFLSSNMSLLLTKKDLNDQLFDTNSIFNLPNSDNENFYFTNQAEKKNVPPEDFARIILIESCLYCDRKEKEINLDLHKPQILPGSIFYRLIRNKEAKEIKEVKNDPSKQIDFYLGISFKRMGEIEQLILLKETNQKIDLSLEEIKRNSKKINDIVNKMDKSDVGVQLEILRINNFLKAENRALNDIAQKSTSKEVKEKIALLEYYIADIYKKNSSFELVYPPDNQKHYAFNIETSGSYELLLKKQDAGQDLSFQKITIDGQEVTTKSVSKNSYYFSLGSTFLSKGHHSLKFEIDNSENLLKDIGDFSIMPNNPECKTINVTNVYPNHRYIFSLNFTTEGRGEFSGPELNIGQFINGREVLPSKVKLGTSSVSKTFSTDIITQDKVNKLNISICHSPGYEYDSLIKVNNLSLKPIIIPLVAAVLDNTSDKNLPEHSVKRINQTQYKVSVKGVKKPYFLILNTAFNSNWQVSFPDGSKLPIVQHIKVNGFANGWLIDRQGDYFLTIEYSPQRYFYLGGVVTVTFLMLVGFYLIITRYYEYKNSKN